MNDMSSTIVAKSDQINAADLIGTPRTITIKEVRIKAGEDQPVTVLIEGDRKVFRPCKGVRRLMVRVWGPDAGKYIGQSMTLFCDPSVTWAGKEEGGIRVSHMSGLDEQIIEYMRTSRAATKPYKILPLKNAPQQQRQAPTDDEAARAHADAERWLATTEREVEAAASMDELAALHTKKARGIKLLERFPDLHERAVGLFSALAHQEGRRDEDFGDQHDGAGGE